jgi:CDP-glycerol glycerophosphotransferase
MLFKRLNLIIKNLIKNIYYIEFLFFLISIPIKFLDILFLRQKNEILFYGYMGRHSGNALSLYRHYLFKKNNLNPIWLLNKKDLSLFSKNDNYFLLPDKDSNVIAHLKLLIKIARAKVIVVSSFGDLHTYCSILYSKKRKEILLPHGTTLKSGGILAKNLNAKQKRVWSSQSKRFDLISVSSRVEQYWTSASLNLNPNIVKILGAPRGDKIDKNVNDYKKKLKNLLDELHINFSDFGPEKLTLALYAPTHRDHDNSTETGSLNKIENYNLSSLSSYLKIKNIILLVREHSLFKNENEFNVSNVVNFSTTLFPNIENYFDLIDIIITDYSGIYLEYLKTNKSIVFAHSDIDEYDERRGLILPKEILFPGYTFKSQESLIQYFDNRFDIDKAFVDKRNFLNSLLYEIPSTGACNRTMLEIDKLINKIK